MNTTDVEGRIVLDLAYNADPMKDPERTHKGIDYIAWVHTQTTPEEFAREMERSWTELEGRPVYTGFKKQACVRDGIVVNKYLNIIRVWDFGFRRAACGFFQWSSEDVLYALHEIHGDSEELGGFASRVLGWCRLNYPAPIYKFEDCCDIAGVQHSDKPRETSIEILRKVFQKKGLPCDLRYKLYRTNEAISLTRELIRAGRLIVSNTCQVLTDGLDHAYCFKKHKPGLPLSETPVKNGIHDHIVDCLHICVVNTTNAEKILFEHSRECPSESEYTPPIDRRYDPVMGGV